MRHRLLEDPGQFSEPQDDGLNILPSYVAPNKYGKCVPIVRTKFPVELAYGSIYVSWALTF
jgi:hypothetical protein